MSCAVERDLFLDTRLSNDLVEAFIAPPVAREFEYASGTRCGHIFQKDIVGHGKQPYIDLRPRFAAGRVDPQLFVYFLDILRLQVADVDIGQSGEQLNKNVSLTSCKVTSSFSYCIIRFISSMVR